jgi:hypothetical protein
MRASSTGSGVAAGRERLTHAMRLYGASARNSWPRVVASMAVAAVAVQSIGPLWVLGWLAIVWTGLAIGIRLIVQFENAGAPAAQARFTRFATLNTAVYTVFQALILAAIWARGDELGRGFALIATFVGSAYVLLQY